MNAPVLKPSVVASGELVFRRIGRPFIAVLQGIGALAVFLVLSLGSALREAWTPRRTLDYIYEIGFKTMPLVAMVAFFTGMVLGLQGYFSLVRFGSEAMVGSLVALSIVREVGPVFAAVMVVGQAGSALTAEIGVQRNSEQLDALNMMGIPPRAYVVGPRILAALISFPLLTAIFNLVGIWGGGIATTQILGLEGGTYWANVRSGLEPSDMFDSHLKGLIFGFLTVTVCAFEGFYTHTRSSSRGARGVSESATRAVVISSVLILFFNYLITSLLLE